MCACLSCLLRLWTLTILGYLSLVSLFVHVVATGWSAWQMAHTIRIKADFNRLTTDGACGHDFLRSYWQARSNAEIPSMALNVASLFVSIFLTWRLVKVCMTALVCRHLDGC